MIPKTFTILETAILYFSRGLTESQNTNVIKMGMSIVLAYTSENLI